MFDIYNQYFLRKEPRLFDRKFDSSKINALLTQNGEKPLLGGGDLENHITLCIREFIRNPKFDYINYADEGHKDAICAERMPLDKIHGARNKLTYLKSYKRHAKGFLDKIVAKILYRWCKLRFVFEKMRGRAEI